MYSVANKKAFTKLRGAGWREFLEFENGRKREQSYDLIKCK